MRGWLRAALALVCLSASAAAHSQSVSYTVQVVALSDREGALGIQSDLIRDGFPAYVVGSKSEAGDVFRVRVGAFANRPAALLYASGMPAVGGVQPVPALAEGIPQGIMPLAPYVLFDEAVGDRSVAVGTLGEQLVLRLQDRVDTPAAAESQEPAQSELRPAEYVIMAGTAVERRRAWRFGEVEGAHLWVRETLLWPSSWPDETVEVREGFRTSLLRLLAERLGVDFADVEAAAFQPVAGEAPRLIVVELEAPDQPDGVRLLGLGLPASGFDAFGPLEYLGIARDDLPPVVGAVTVAELLAGSSEPVEGEGFTATSDGAYVRLTAGALSWRAGLGRPLWSDGRRLLALVEERLLVYGFVQR
ncbi:MAG TPA: SPOR domain-containing protein [Trueperaceae bacterium]|nr:SPOR domain-containing protein [Trueperaceae bacterium]